MNGKISKNYAWELYLVPRKMETAKNAVTFVDFRIDWMRSRQWDHCPRFDIYLEILNFKLFEFSVYNVNHAEE